MTNRRVYQANVFKRCVRILPLDEAVTQIEPKQVMVNRQALRL
jgi:serine/threonine protein phosphatase 1